MRRRIGSDRIMPATSTRAHACWGAFAAILVSAPLALGAGGDLSAASEARVHLARAGHAGAAGDWQTALREYTRASQLEPSSTALQGIAASYDALHDAAAAYRAYEALLTSYGSQIGADVRRRADSRLAELARATEALAIDVDEPGARITIDDALVGTSPLPGLVRVNPGSHRVRAETTGGLAADAELQAVAGRTEPLALHVRRPAAAAAESSAVAPHDGVAALPAAQAAPPRLVIGPDPDAQGRLNGFYGGVLLHALFEPGGMHGTICSIGGVTNCSVSAPVGAGLLGAFGYMREPLGVDALFGIQADAATVTATAEGTTAKVVVPRAGGVFAVRARAAWQNPAARFSFAAGTGFSLRGIGLLAGSVDTSARFSPAVTLDANAEVRVGSRSAIAVGLLYWGENAGRGETLQVKPLGINVVVARGPQSFIMPYVGLEIGP